MGRRQTRRQVRDRLKSLHDEDEEDVQGGLEAIEPLRRKDADLYKLCGSLIRAGDISGAEKQLTRLLERNPFGSFVGSFGGLGGLIGIGVGGFLLIRAFFPGLLGGGSPAQITSTTPACSEDVENALGAFKRDMGLAFEQTGREPDELFQDEMIEKGYARDGTRYEVAFRAEREDEQCKLVLYRRAKQEPGSWSSRTGSFGSVTLADCECE